MRSHHGRRRSTKDTWSCAACMCERKGMGWDGRPYSGCGSLLYCADKEKQCAMHRSGSGLCTVQQTRIHNTVMRMFCCMQDCCCPQHTDDCVEDEAGTAQPDGGVLPRQSGIKAGTSLRSRVARCTVAAARAAAAKRRRPFMRQAIHCSQVAHYRSALWELQRTIHQQRNL